MDGLRDWEWAAARPATAQPTATSGAATTVVLFGWTGCSRPALRKYAQVWQGLGCATLACCGDIAKLWLPSRAAASVDQLARALVAHTSGGPVVLHLFSGAPSMFLPSLCRHELAAALGVRIAGLVFDSCPVNFTRASGVAAVQQMREQKAIPALAAPLITAAGICVEWVNGGRMRQQLQEVMASALVAPHPALFLLCEAGDEVAPAEAVRHWARQHAITSGGRVSLQSWLASQHVRHLLHHPAEYTATLRKFLLGVTPDTRPTQHQEQARL
jgi:hypothetical protein